MIKAAVPCAAAFFVPVFGPVQMKSGSEFSLMLLSLPAPCPSAPKRFAVPLALCLATLSAATGQQAQANQRQAAAQIEQLGTMVAQYGPGRTITHRIVTRLQDCDLTITHFKPYSDNAERIEWQDEIPLSAMLFNDPDDQGNFSHPTAFGQREGEPIFRVLMYKVLEPRFIARLVPTEKDPRAPVKPGPIIAGTQYSLGERQRGGITYLGIRDPNAPEAFARAIVEYKANYCQLIG
jgi:hypothetical protein